MFSPHLRGNPTLLVRGPRRGSATTNAIAWLSVAASLAVSLVGAQSAHAACLTPPGDVNGNGITNVADVQCTNLYVLWALAGGESGSDPLPACAFGGISRADLNCDNLVTVADTTIAVFNAMGIPLNAQIDSTGTQCADACEAASAVCGNGIVELGEECDEGPANNNFLADFCRTNCKLPSCGDGVVDSGEQCDDGNLVASDGCENNCTLSAAAVSPLPYVQSFNVGNFGSQGWTIESDPGSAANNWTLTTAGPLGPDQHPRFFYLPSVTNYTDRLISPVLNASAAQYVTISFDQAISLNNATASTTFRVLVSSNGGQNWTVAWSRSGADGALASTRTVVDASAQLAGSDEARIAFEIVGPASTQIVYWEIDQVEVRPNAAPVIAPIANVTLTAGTSETVTVTAADLDTAPGALVFSLHNQPSFATIVGNGDGTATITIAPGINQTGNWPNVRAQVSDGTYAVSTTFGINVLTSPANTPASVRIRSAANGGGVEVNDIQLALGQTLPLFAAAYNSTGTFLYDLAVKWSAQGTLNPVTTATTKSIVFSPITAGTSGFITATPTNAAIAPDSTGTITVVAPSGGGPDLVASSVTVSPSSIKADGVSTATVTVTIFNTAGQPVDGATVVIAATKGILLGAVNGIGQGQYQQTIRSDAQTGVSLITASVNGQALTKSATLQFVDFFDITGAATVYNCDNYDQHRGKNLRIVGTLTINSNPTALFPEGCAPMEFGDIVIESTGTLTHSVTTAAIEYSTDIQVRSLTVVAGGRVNMDGKGYLGGPTSGTQLGYTRGNLQVGAPDQRGGSHGGLGGKVTQISQVYGNFTDPRFPGGGSGPYITTTSIVGRSGGGVFRVKATEAVIVHGIISTNGTASVSGVGGGAGGSILIDTPFLGGTGEIQSNGGAGHTGTIGGAGGGGRIAIRGYSQLSGVFVPATIATRVKAHAGIGSTTTAGGAGTIYLQGATDPLGRLIVDNNNHNTPRGSTPILVVPPGVVSSIDDNSLTDFAALLVEGDYVGTYVKPNILRPYQSSCAENDEALRIVENDDITLTLSSAAPLSSLTAPLLPYRGALYLSTLDVRGRGAVAVNGDIDIEDGNWIAPALGVLRVDGWLEGTRIDLAQYDTLELSQGGLHFPQTNVATAQIDACELPPSFQFANMQTATLDVPTILLGGGTFASSTVQTGSLAATGPLSFTGSTVTSAALTGTAASFAGSSTLNIGAVTLSGSLSFAAGTASFGTVDVGDDFTIGGGGTVTITEDVVRVHDRLDILNSSTLTHAPNVAGGPVRRLDIEAKSVLVESGSFIDLNEKGFAGSNNNSIVAYTSGNSQVGGATSTQGGSHGGLGGRVTEDRVYGNLYAPMEPGAGGGANTVQAGAAGGGPGGGAVRIKATDIVRVDGSIRANGGNGVGGGNDAGGAGGSVFIETAILTGTGSLLANGGSGRNSTSNPAGAGSGGRIAVVGTTLRGGGFAGSSIIGSVLARGGTALATGVSAGGAGTVYLRSATQPYGELIIDNGGVIGATRSTPVWVPAQSELDFVSGNTVTDGGAAFPPNRFLNLWLNPNIVQGGADTPLAQQQIFRILSHTFNTMTLAGSVSVGSVASAGDTYKGILPLDRLEVRGNANFYVNGDLLVRFGDISSGSSTTFTLGGTLEADTVDFNNISAILATAGGLKANRVFTQGGTLQPLGLTLGGGATMQVPALRVTDLTSTSGSVVVDSIEVLGNLSLTNTALNTGNFFINGTATLRNCTGTTGVIDAASILIDDGTLDVARLLSDSNIDIEGNAAVTVSDRFVSASGSVALRDAAILRHCETNADKVCDLVMQANALIVEAGSAVDVSGRGYLGSTVNGVPAFTNGNTQEGGANSSLGGSHGGLGGGITNPLSAFDSIYSPRQPGGGGAFSNRNASYLGPGGTGGGVFVATIGTLVAIDGAIRANGTNGGNSTVSGFTGTLSGAGGSGGSVDIQTPFLGGNGTIEARGGNGRVTTSANGGSGGGGGGRIAIKGLESATGGFAPATFATKVDARGGNGTTSPVERGGAGTIYVQYDGQTYGDLIIDNKNVVTTGYSTPIRVVPERVTTALGGNTMADVGAAWLPGIYNGTWINPNVDQPEATTGLIEQKLFRINSHTEDTMNLAGLVPLGTVATVGDTYRGVLALDNFELRGQARVSVNGDVLVQSGDISSNNTTTMVIGGILKCNVLDLGTVQSTTINNTGGFEVEGLFSNGSTTFPTAYTFSGGFVSAPAITASAITGTGGSVTASSVDVLGNVSLTGAGNNWNVQQLTVGGNLDVTAAQINLGDVNVTGSVFFTNGPYNLGTLVAGGDVRLQGTAALSIENGTLTVGQALVLEDSALLTHCDPTSDKVCALNVTADTVFVSAGTSIDVSNRGYLGANFNTTAYTLGNTQAGGAVNLQGGSHSAPGGFNTAPGLVYGSFLDPSLPGSGGGGNQDTGPTTPISYTGGNGGGVVRITVGTSLVVDGAIRANGQAGAGGWGAGGAGGSIDIITPNLAGTSGFITANGGTGRNVTSTGAGGGSGGRVAIKGLVNHTGVFANATLPDRVQARGAEGFRTGFNRAGAGTVFIRRATDTYGSLIVDNANLVTVWATRLSVMPQGFVLGINNGARTITDWGANWNLGDYVGTWVNPNIEQPSTGGGLAELTFFPVVAHTNKVMTLGGTAPVSSVAQIGKIYRGVLLLEQLTVRNRAHLQVEGGVLVTNGNWNSAPTDPFTLGGILQAPLVDLNQIQQVVLPANSELRADEVFTKAPGEAGIAVVQGGHLNITGATFDEVQLISGTVTLSQGQCTIDSMTMSGGTLNVTAELATFGSYAQSGGTATFGGTTAYSGTVHVEGNLTLSNAAVINMAHGDLVVDGAVNLTGTSRLAQLPTTASQTYRLHLTAGEVIVGATAAIDAAGRGYLGRENTSTAAITWDNSATGGAGRRVGGSHGGRGVIGVSGDTGVPITYGSVFDPRSPGGGGGSGFTTANTGTGKGGDGGGVIWITADVLEVNGVIDARGADATLNAAGGAGGSIRIETPLLRGTGFISVAGGGRANTNGGGGGGGRVAIWGASTLEGAFALNQIWDNVRTHGGIATNGATYGGSGTFYLHMAGDQFGTLIVNNNNFASLANSTPLVVVPGGTVLDLLSENELQATAAWTPGLFYGVQVSPNSSAAPAGRLTGRQVFPLLGNIADTLTFDLPIGANLSTMTAIGSPFRTTYKFKNLELRGQAKLEVSNGDILILEGDLKSNNTTTFDMPASTTLTATLIDLNLATKTGTGTTTGTVVTGP